MKLGLEGKVVIVTGGSKGIGHAIVQGFIEEGAKVHFCGRNHEDIKTGILNFSYALGSDNLAHGYVCDVSVPSQIESWIKAIASKEGRIDVVVSNTAYQTDMLSTVTLIDSALPHLEKSKGNIVTISSVSEQDIDFTAPSPYGAFKATLIHYTSQLAHTLAPKGFRANTVSPGNIYIHDGVWGSIEKDNPELFKSQMGKNPMGRMGKASEVADAVIWVSSERAGFVSGGNLVVDGALCNGVQF